MMDLFRGTLGIGILSNNVFHMFVGCMHADDGGVDLDDVDVEYPGAEEDEDEYGERAIQVGSIAYPTEKEFYDRCPRRGSLPLPNSCDVYYYCRRYSPRVFISTLSASVCPKRLKKRKIYSLPSHFNTGEK